MAMNRTPENRRRPKGMFTVRSVLVLKPSGNWLLTLQTEAIIHVWLALLSLITDCSQNSNGSTALLPGTSQP